jgi:hypothetical protein
VAQPQGPGGTATALQEVPRPAETGRTPAGPGSKGQDREPGRVVGRHGVQADAVGHTILDPLSCRPPGELPVTVQCARRRSPRLRGPGRCLLSSRHYQERADVSLRSPRDVFATFSAPLTTTTAGGAGRLRPHWRREPWRVSATMTSISMAGDSSHSASQAAHASRRSSSVRASSIGVNGSSSRTHPSRRRPTEWRGARPLRIPLLASTSAASVASASLSAAAPKSSRT